MRPQAFVLCIGLADVMMRLGAPQDAQVLFKKAAQASDSATLTMLADCLRFHNEWAASEEVLMQVMRDHPKDWSAPLNLAQLLLELWRVEETLTLINSAEKLAISSGRWDQASATIEALRTAALGKEGLIDVAVARHREAAEQQGPLSPRRSSAAMTALYSDHMSAAEVTALHAELFSPLKALFQAPVWSMPNQPSQRLRIGYLSSDLFRQHPVNLFMQPVLAHHNLDRFDVTVYYSGEVVDEQTRLARSRVGHWCEVKTLSDEALTDLIRTDSIDVLVDLSGQTSLNRLGVLARRAAPVQINYLGYPYTSGVPSMDYLIADSVVVPPAQSDLYTEQVLRLPHAVFCYAPEENYPLSLKGDAWMSQTTVFGSFGNVMKLTKSTIALWARVLSAVPDSKLLLKSPSFSDAGAVNRFVSAFAAQGISPERIECRGPSGLTEMMAQYSDVDIVLDTMPYNGGTTTLQAIWMGCPVITKAGEGFHRRMGASAVTAAGHPEWVANSADEFVEKALKLATDRLKLREIKNCLRAEYLNSAASDIASYTRALEGLFEYAWTSRGS